MACGEVQSDVTQLLQQGLRNWSPRHVETDFNGDIGSAVTESLLVVLLRELATDLPLLSLDVMSCREGDESGVFVLAREHAVAAVPQFPWKVEEAERMMRSGVLRGVLCLALSEELEYCSLAFGLYSISGTSSLLSSVRCQY